jgi:hypothetical protein
VVLKDTSIGRLILEQLTTEKTAGKKCTGKVHVEDAKRISSGLKKVAELPYKEEVYRSVQEMMKIASGYMTDLVEALESVKARNSDLEKAAEVRVVIDDMARFGGIDEYNVEEKVAELMGKTAQELSIIKEAIKMVQNGKEGNQFFEIEKDASTSSNVKKGIFDGVVS